MRESPRAGHGVRRAAGGVAIVTPKLMASSSGKTAMFIASQPADQQIHEAAIRIARRCRWLIQACLREEEWGDADREFYLVIRDGLERFVEARGAPIEPPRRPDA